MNTIQKIKSTYPNLALGLYVDFIENNLKDCKTVLDIGCGNDSPLKHLSKKFTLAGVDGYEEAIQESKKRKIHSKYYKLDIRNLSKKFKPNSYDAVVALDVIEHFHKKEGYKLLKDMQKIAKKKVILNTPNGYIPQHDVHNDLQEHLSGWTTKDFKDKGFKVYGMYGLKALRKYQAEIRLKPKFLWGMTSIATHFFITKHIPIIAFSLTAVKDLTQPS